MVEAELRAVLHQRAQEAGATEEQVISTYNVWRR